jgi:hypothetical protein
MWQLLPDADATQAVAAWLTRDHAGACSRRCAALGRRLCAPRTPPKTQAGRKSGSAVLARPGSSASEDLFALGRVPGLLGKTRWAKLVFSLWACSRHSYCNTVRPWPPDQGHELLSAVLSAAARGLLSILAPIAGVIRFVKINVYSHSVTTQASLHRRHSGVTTQSSLRRPAPLRHAHRHELLVPQRVLVKRVHRVHEVVFRRLHAPPARRHEPEHLQQPQHRVRARSCARIC